MFLVMTEILLTETLLFLETSLRVKTNIQILATTHIECVVKLTRREAR